MLDPLAAIQRAQNGLVTNHQALKVVSPGRLRGRRDRGVLRLVRPGVYVASGIPDSWELQLHAAVLSASGVASHRSAARLYGLPVSAERLEITLPRGRQTRMTGVTVHTSNVLLASFVTCIRTIPATTPARTAMDLSAVVGRQRCARAIDELDRRDLASYVQVDECYRAMRRRGRRRVRVVEAIMAERLDGVASGDSDWEMRLARWLVDTGLPRPEQNAWVVAGGARFCLDLAYRKPKIAIEFDGWDTHRQRGRYDADRKKWRTLELDGWTVLPYTSACTRPEVVGDVRRALERRTS